MTTLRTTPSSIGSGLARIEGPDKVTGAARYAFEYRADDPCYGWIVSSPVAKGRLRRVDTAAALASPGVVAVITHANAPRLEEADDPELSVLQSDRIAYTGQIVALVAATSLEAAREGARLVRVEVDAEDHDSRLRVDHPGLYEPETVNPSFPGRTEDGDVDAALAAAAVTVDAVYETSPQHNNPMEPHATLAEWHGDRLLLHDSNQGAAPVAATLAALFGLEGPESVHVIAPHVGGGFGSKGTPRPVVVAAALLARVLERPVKLASSRQQQWSFVGYRTPTIQRIRLGADADGRLQALSHDVVEQSSTLREFAEQTATCSRTMYASGTRRTTHKLARLDVPTPSWMRAPGEEPGMFALESAMDELAEAVGLDPVELRIRNEPDRDPETGSEWSSRHLVECLRQGAERFGWAQRPATPGSRRQGRWMVGYGMAASTYPARSSPSTARVTDLGDGRYDVALAAADIGTGARTALTQIAADALGVETASVRLQLGDSALPQAPLAGGSMGTNSWGWAITKAGRAILAGEGTPDADGRPAVTADTSDDIDAQSDAARHAFGAQFAEVHVDPLTGEVRCRRLTGVFACGRIVNPVTARSQFIGGMTMGLGAALLEESVMDHEWGKFVNHDLADYHVPVYADIPSFDVSWLEEDDPEVNLVGTKGIGEIGIVGTAAAIANAVHSATGVRLRAIPLTPARMLQALAAG